MGGANNLQQLMKTTQGNTDVAGANLPVSPSRLKGLPCHGTVSFGVFSDATGVDRPEILVTAGQHAAIATSTLY